MEGYKNVTENLENVDHYINQASIIWRPVTEIEFSAFKNLRKKAIKWIFNELYQYYDKETYLLPIILKSSQIKIIPMIAFFDINDFVLFHKLANINMLNFINMAKLGLSFKIQMAKLGKLWNYDHNWEGCLNYV